MSEAQAQPAHATLIAARRAGLWRGALLRGPSGIGKSDLALRALAAGWALVADDRVRLWVSGGVAYGSAPPSLAGLVEARGLGVAPRPCLRFARIALVADGQTDALLVAADRIPEPAWTYLDGVSVPVFRLPFLDVCALARLDLALDAAMRRRRAL